MNYLNQELVVHELLVQCDLFGMTDLSLSADISTCKTFCLGELIETTYGVFISCFELIFMIA